jgi:hypothetical protein
METDPDVRVPIVTAARGGALDERMTRVLRWKPLQTARALARLEAAERKAECLRYWGGDKIHDRYEVLRSTILAASEADALSFAAVNVSFKVAWETVPLSKLEKDLAGMSLKPGPFAGICRAPEVSLQVFAPAAGQGESEDEKKASAGLAADARALRASTRELKDAFGGVLEALEGQKCGEAAKEFYWMVSAQRQAFFEHRESVLGRLMMQKMRWEPVGD